MKFEQAFYTRDSRVGLHIAASSNMSKSFLSKCMSVGSNFEVEPTDNTAEFVYYSEAFQRYVGVGVSPAGYKDEAGMNKLVHIFVPEIDSKNPSDYYLPYDFERTMDNNKEYSNEEFEPSIKEEDFDKILQKYECNKTQLAELLHKFFPIIFNKKNFLAIELPLDKYDQREFPIIAREFTWLMYHLIPVPSEEKDKYRTRLSYSVLSKRNVVRVNIAYVEDASAYRDCYYLNGSYKEEVDSIYEILAEKALVSKEEYDSFVKELFDCRLEREVNIESLELMFFQWQLKYENVMILREKLKKESLPIPLNSLIAKARRNTKYRNLLYQVVSFMENLSPKQLADLSAQVFREALESIEESQSSLFITAYKNALEIAFRVKYQYYVVYFQDLDRINDKDKIVKRQIINELWDDGSCVREDINTVQNKDEVIEKLNLYRELAENDSFVLEISSIAILYYFEMDKNERKSISRILDVENEEEVSNWKLLVKKEIEQFFSSIEEFSKPEKETDKIEDDYVLDYFNEMMKCCRKAKSSSKRDALQKFGKNFMKFYKDSLPNRECDEFYELEKLWEQEELYRSMEEASLEELSKFEGFEDFSDEILKKWYQEVKKRFAQNEKMTDNALQCLMERKDKLKRDYTRSYEEYIDNIWKACGDEIECRLYVLMKLGKSEYTIWNCIGLCDVNDFKKISDWVAKHSKYRSFIENPRGCVGDADFNRRCYQFWEKVYQNQKNLSKCFRDIDINKYRDEYLQFLGQLQNEMIEKGDSDACRMYLQIEVEKRKVGSRNKAKKYDFYQNLRQSNFSFYKRLQKLAPNDLDSKISQYLEELKIFEKLVSREAVSEKNIVIMASLLYESERWFGLENEVKELDDEYKKMVLELEEDRKKLDGEKKELENQIRDLKEHLEKVIREGDDKKRKLEKARQAREGEPLENIEEKREEAIEQDRQEPENIVQEEPKIEKLKIPEFSKSKKNLEDDSQKMQSFQNIYGNEEIPDSKEEEDKKKGYSIGYLTADANDYDF